MLLFVSLLCGFALYMVEPTKVPRQLLDAGKKADSRTSGSLRTLQSLAHTSSLEPNAIARRQAAYDVRQVTAQHGSTSERNPARTVSHPDRAVPSAPFEVARSPIQLKLMHTGEPSSSPSPTWRIAQAPERIDCGTAWTDWVDDGGEIGNPCPKECTRGAELARSFRVVGFPPRTQTRYLFQCWRQ